jgi:hypothetical protein
MVPVKKPGRPLSACPHLHNQLCGCSSVTAAIPRKQKCHCGTGPSAGPPPAVQPRPVVSAIPDIPSPTKVTFRVQKPSSSSRPSSRKQSYDLGSLERMDSRNVNIVPFQNLASQTAFGQAVRNGQFPSIEYAQYSNDLQDPRPNAKIPDPSFPSQYPDLHGQPQHANGTYTAPASAIATADNLYLQLETVGASPVVNTAPSGGGSCCRAKPDIRSVPTTFASQIHTGQGSVNGDSLTDVPVLSGVSSTSSGATPETPKSNGHLETKQHLFPTEYSISQEAYKAYLPETTTYAYPASYGSYQHPLQPWEWRNMSNMYAQPFTQSQISDSLTTFTSDALLIPDTIHTCTCGHECQCIGCAAHPYNTATQNYVRSACNIGPEPSISTIPEYLNGHKNDNAFPSTTDPPVAETPSDSSSAEEQILSATDYFFVNYPYSGDGCGGDTNGCPCGDNCQCIGCAIHRFGESTMALPSDSWANSGGDAFTSGNGTDFTNGTLIKDEDSDDAKAGRPVKSCCGG